MNDYHNRTSREHSLRIVGVLAVLCGGLLLLMMLTGCTQAPQEPQERTVELSDGTHLLCLQNGTQLSCDWEGHKPNRVEELEKDNTQLKEDNLKLREDYDKLVNTCGTDCN